MWSLWKSKIARQTHRNILAKEFRTTQSKLTNHKMGKNRGPKVTTNHKTEWPKRDLTLSTIFLILLRCIDSFIQSYPAEIAITVFIAGCLYIIVTANRSFSQNVQHNQAETVQRSQVAAKNKDPLTLGSSTLKHSTSQDLLTSSVIQKAQTTSPNPSQNHLTSRVGQKAQLASPYPSQNQLTISGSQRAQPASLHPSQNQQTSSGSQRAQPASPNPSSAHHADESSTVNNILKSSHVAEPRSTYRSTNGITTVKLPCGHTMPASDRPNPDRTTLVSNSQQAQTAANSNLRSTGVANVPVVKKYLLSDILKMELRTSGSAISEEISAIPTSEVELRRYLIKSHCGKLKITRYKLKPEDGAHYKYLRIDTDSSGIQWLVATTKLKICERHVQHTFVQCQDEECGGLHVCKFYLLSGECMMTMQGHPCAFGHDLHTPHNQKLLEEHLLQDLAYFFFLCDYLGILFRLNRSQSCYPKLCKDYNSNDQCAKGDLCMRLHCCKDYLIHNCHKGDKCQYSHNIFDMQPKNVLNMYGFETWRREQEIFSEVYDGLCRYGLYEDSADEWLGWCFISNERQKQFFEHLDGDNDEKQMNSTRAENRGRSSSRNSEERERSTSRNKQMERLNRKLKSLGWNSLTKKLVSACVYRAQNQLDFKEEKENDNGPEICLEYLMGQCGSSCSLYHCDLPYQWQYYHAATKSWTDFPESENYETETDFCHGSDGVGYFGHDSLDIVASVSFKERKLKLLLYGSLQSLVDL